MKHGTEYAKRIKRLHQRLLRKHGKPAASDLTDPLEQVLIGILAEDTTPAKATAVYRKLSQRMVDLNELRVTPAIELAQLIGTSVPRAADKARQIVAFLNAVRRRQDTLDLDFLRQRGRREVREYLDSLDGVPRSAAARVMLFSLGGHAIPVDDLTLYVLRKEELVDPSADAAEVQSFLERHISAATAAEFVVLLCKFVSAHASRIPAEKLPELLNPLPEPAPEPEPKVERKTGTRPSPKAAASKSQDAAGKTSTSQRKAKRPTLPVRKKK